MKFCSDTDFSKFIKTVQKCKKDVFFVSSAGDRLNLKSELSKFLFSAIKNNAEIMQGGIIECESDADMALLKDFIAE